MGESPKGIAVGLVNNRVFVRIVGRGTFQNSQPLRLYALEMIEAGREEFIVDLGQCQGMDSTFLGVLAGIGLRLRQGGRSTLVHVINISSRNLELLQTLGLDRLFTINSNALPAPADTDLHPLADTDITQLSHPLDKDETTDLMLEAHDNLINADERNAPKFKELTKFLREKVERRRTDDEEKS